MKSKLTATDIDTMCTDLTKGLRTQAQAGIEYDISQGRVSQLYKEWDKAKMRGVVLPTKKAVAPIIMTVTIEQKLDKAGYPIETTTT